MYITRWRGRRGYVTVMAIVVTVAILAVAVVTVDLGKLFTSKQRVQATVDASALAGAQHLPRQGAAGYWAQECLVANAADTPGLQMDVGDGTNIVYYSGGDTIPGYGTLGPDIHAIRVESTGSFQYSFARALGWDTGEVTCAATAIGKNTAGWGAVFVEDFFTSDNAHMEISASVHSNNAMIYDGADGFIGGETTYVHSLSKDRCTVDFQGPVHWCSTKPRPTDVTADDFSVDYDILMGDDPQIDGVTCSGGNITALNQSSVDFPEGVYECNDLILRECGSITGDKTSFLVHGRVVLDNNGPVQLSGAQHDMALYVTGTSSQAIELDNGDPIQLTGGLCVPNGGLYFDHSELRVTNGVIYSDTLLIDQAGTIVNIVTDARVASHVKLIQ